MVLLADKISGVEIYWICLVVSALFNSFSISIAKNRLNVLGKMDVLPLRNFFLYLLRFFCSPVIWFASVLFILSPFIWLYSFNQLQLSLAYPSYYSLNLIFVFIFSVTILKEKISAMKIAGAFFLIAAIYLFYSV